MLSKKDSAELIDKLGEVLRMGWSEFIFIGFKDGGSQMVHTGMEQMEAIRLLCEVKKLFTPEEQGGVK